MTEQIEINALELPDDELTILSFARYLNLTKGKIDRLADGGAQLILSVGRNYAMEVFPEGMNFSLTPKDGIDLNNLLENAALKETIAFAQESKASDWNETIKIARRKYRELTKNLR